MNAPSSRSTSVLAVTILIVVGAIVWKGGGRTDTPSIAPSKLSPRASAGQASDDGVTMADVLDRAQAARDRMAESLDDYTARFVKRERDATGVLGDESEIEMKVQTKLRGDTDNAPMRVHLRYVSPESVRGREVLWGEDLNDGKLAVYENMFPLNLKTIWLDPEGLIAMRGQRYPISEIGLVRLVEKLIERGEKDRNNPEIKVEVDTNYEFDGKPAELIQVRRLKPASGEDDFSLAEIVIDPEQELILSYRSFGWPANEDDEPPLLESYQYLDLKTNVGLTDEDFDVANPGYAFP